MSCFSETKQNVISFPFPCQMSYKAVEFAVEQSLSDLLFLVNSQERPIPLPEKILVPPKRK